ncbi:MAG: hypothetical protein ACJ8C4_06620 [Gemmataceae bacterium]
MATDTGNRLTSNQFARARDARLAWLLSRHPATAGMLAAMGLFTTRKKASKRLARLARRGAIRLLGTVSLKDGRPEHVYGRGRWKTDNLLHEVLLTQVCRRIDAEEVRRGPGDTDSDLRADAELWINGRRYFLELDRGTMGYEEVIRKRFSRYATSTDFVLWVCPNDSRMEGLRRRGSLLRRTALFTTFGQLLADPHGRIWRDADGATAALPRSGGHGA